MLILIQKLQNFVVIFLEIFETEKYLKKKYLKKKYLKQIGMRKKRAQSQHFGKIPIGTEGVVIV